MPLLLVPYLKQRLQVVDHQLTLGIFVSEQEQSLEKAESHEVVRVGATVSYPFCCCRISCQNLEKNWKAWNMVLATNERCLQYVARAVRLLEGG